MGAGGIDDDITTRVGDHERPLLLPDEEHLYRALAFLDAGQVKAAAVHVRTAFELALKAGCQQFGLGVKFNPDPRKVPASDFWTALKSAEYDVAPSPQCATNSKGKVVWWQPQPTRHRVVPIDLVRRIEHAVSWVLNPLSHSQTVDRYRAEIEDAIYAVDELSTSIENALALRSVKPYCSHANACLAIKCEDCQFAGNTKLPEAHICFVSKP